MQTAAVETCESGLRAERVQGRISDLTLLAAACALKKEFAEAIGWQEKVIEFAAEPQKGVAKKILELYQKNEPLDPKLLDMDESAENSSSPAKADAKASPKSNEAPNT